MTKRYLTTDELRKYIGYPAEYAFMKPLQIGRLINVYDNGEIDIELYSGSRVYSHSNLRYGLPYINGKRIKSEEWASFSIILEWEDSCLYCDSKCKSENNIPCSLYKPYVEMRK